MASSPAVLLVESDILLRHPLAEYLRECGFKVFEAATGGEARVMLEARETAIDVVLADLNTDGSGFQLRQWIKSQGIDVEVILAGSVEKAVDEAGTLCREGPALAKPYQHHLVLDEIRRGLARRERGRP
jgi:DNA-binding response OmpR family regulator